jgi:SNF2 family DNA or RNA helicase
VNNGRIWLQDGRWHIEAAPHVAIRAKRVFGQLGAGHVGILKVKDTPDVCRDISWFCERYPMEMNSEHARYLREREAGRRERETVVAKLLAGLGEATRFDLALPPREYQRRAADLLLRTGGLLLGDDVGLGKTVSAIAAISDPRARPALVVTLTHLPRQWAAEFARFAPQLRIHVLKKATPYDITAVPVRRRPSSADDQGTLPGMRPPMPDVIITNYHKLAGWAETLAPVVKSVFFDEAQELRTGPGTDSRPGSSKYEAAALIAEHAAFRCGLTATPIYNYGEEIWNILNVLRPDAIGTRREFLTEWCAGGGDGKARIKEPEAFGTYLRAEGIMLRRTRAEVGRELPALTKVPHEIDADAGALDKVGRHAAELAKLILAQGGGGFDKLKASEELSNVLRQATGIAKAPYVAEFVRLLLENGEQRVLLYGHHHAVYQIWKDRLEDVGVAFYTGEQSASQKEAAKASFISGEARVMVMALRAGAGLDGLQSVCRTIVHGELDWAPGVHDQCDGRIHRDGQKEPVMSYYLIADSGSDPIVSDVLGVKRAQLEGIRDPDGAVRPLIGSDKDIRRLAEDVLRRRGVVLEAASVAAGAGA